MTTPRPPRTPLRRISRGSLRALSASQQIEGGQNGDAVGALMPVLAELRDQFEDLKTNMAALGRVDSALSTFNDAFGSYLYGLKVNAYTGIFPEEPGPMNMALARQRRRRREEEQQQQVGRGTDEAEADREERRGQTAVPFSSPGSVGEEGEEEQEEEQASRRARATTTTTATTAARGRGRGRARTQHARKLVDFAGPIVDTLPIKYREDPEMRRQAESVLGVLKKHKQGLRIAEIVREDTHQLQTHRVNDILLALLRAKHVVRRSERGLVYALDARHM